MNIKMRSRRLSIPFVLAIACLLIFSMAEIGCGASSNAAGQATTNEVGSKDLFRQALANSLSVDSKNLSGSIDVDSGSTKFKGEFSGSPAGNNARMKASLDVNSSMNGVPVSMSAEEIAIGTGVNDKNDVYMRFTSVTTSDSSRRQALEAVFAPVINKWVKTTIGNGSDKPTTFENEGPLAALDLLGFYAPLVSLNDSDKNIFLSSVDKNNVYTVEGGVEQAQYNGAPARKIKVVVDKNAIMNVDKEVSASISKSANYKSSDVSFLGEVFGKSGKLTACVYLSPDAAKIIGVEINLDLDTPIEDNTFHTTLDKIKVSASINYSPGPAIAAPDSYMTEQEMDALMKG